MLKCQRILSLPERLREVFVMFPGDVTFPGAEFSDGIQGPPALVLRIGCHTRTRSNDIIHRLPDDLGCGNETRPGDSLNLFCLFFRKLYLCSDHAAPADYTYYIMIANDREDGKISEGES
jgi:hypothetical protein